jgi:hypothetical protein
MSGILQFVSRKTVGSLSWPAIAAASVSLIVLATAPAWADDAKADTPGTVTSAEPLSHSALNEEKILAELEKPTDFDFSKTPLGSVADFIAGKHGMAVLIDEKALEEADMSVDTPITFHLKGTSLRSALRLMLEQLNLAIVVRDEVLQITTNERAETILIARSYPVGDLILDDDYDPLIAAITSTASPTTWDEGGGPASVTAVDSAQSLVISQTPDAHYRIQDLLRSLRVAKTVASKEPRTKHAAAKPPVKRVAKGGGMM